MQSETVPLIQIPDIIPVRIVERLNRFVVLVKAKGKVGRAHINNTGRLDEFMVAGLRAYVIPARSAGKTDFRLFAVQDGDSGALFDTQFQMRAFEKALDGRHLNWAEGCRMVRRNPRLGESVMDYLLEREGMEIYVEVKSAVLRQGNHATYPDCPTLRGQRHIRELTQHSKAGGQSIILFIGALPHVEGFMPYSTGDPEIAPLLIEARKAGVSIRALGLQFNVRSGIIELTDPDLPVTLLG